MKRHKGRKIWENRKFRGKILSIPRSMQYPYAIFYNNMKMRMLSWIKKRMISAGQGIMHSKPKISLVLFNTNTSNAATSIVRFLTRRFSLLYSIPEVIYPLLRVLKRYSTGLLAIFQGRYIKRQRALKSQLQFGPASGNTFAAPLDFAQRWVTLRYGVGSIKISMEVFKKNIEGAGYHFFFIAFRSEYYKARAIQRRARKIININYLHSVSKMKKKKKIKFNYVKNVTNLLFSKFVRKSTINFSEIKKRFRFIKIISSKENWGKNIPIKGYSSQLLKLFARSIEAYKKSKPFIKKIRLFQRKQKAHISKAKTPLKYFLKMQKKINKLGIIYLVQYFKGYARVGRFRNFFYKKKLEFYKKVKKKKLTI